MTLLATRTPRPWLMLAFGVLAQASSTVFVSTPAFLIPLLHTERGLSLASGRAPRLRAHARPGDSR